jgi:tRNA (guanine37-N1)-methyltransferase
VEAIEEMAGGPATRVLLSPAGERLNQRIVEELAQCPRLLLIAGRYEGFDERIRSGLSPREISIGDYVLSGGEAAAMVVTDAVVRLVPGVLGHGESAAEESFSILPEGAGSEGGTEAVAGVCLEYPQYTRPAVFRGMEVPRVLMSGDHGRIRAWRAEQALGRTTERRPDLLSGRRA